MQILPIEQVSPGAVLGKNIYVDGRILVRAGAELTSHILQRLFELGIRTVYTTDPFGNVEDVPDVVSDETRQEAYRAVRAYAEGLTGNGKVDKQPVNDAVGSIIDDVMSNRKVVLQLTEIRAMDDYVFGHCVGVCTSSVLLGIHAGFTPKELHTMAVGALLHDVGKVKIPDKIWDKPGKLNDEEYQIVQQHTVHGFDILRQKWEFDLRSAHVAYQHHERYDGSGYPRGLAGDQIHRFARLVSVADVFDALTTDRPYRPAWARAKAIQFMQEQSGRSFDPEFLQTFLSRIAPYPVGSLVRLNNGKKAQVVRIHQDLPGSPVVRLLEQPDVEVDLAAKSAWRIIGPVAPSESASSKAR